MDTMMEQLGAQLAAVTLDERPSVSMNASTAAGLSSGQADTKASNGHTHDEVDSDLQALALSSSITELSYGFEAVSTLIFEIQELRHALTASAKQLTEGEQNDGGRTADVDAALFKLDDQLEATNKEVTALGERIEALGSAGFLDEKWRESLASWNRIKKEAEDMREELMEDKYLTVYRTVSQQAEDMMQSLEKVFSQCNTFVHEIYTRYGTSKSPGNIAASDDEELQKHLNTFLALHKSLHQKTKYYIPSCEKVLKVIDSGIGQQKRSLNGEILRSHADMKARWRNLQERMTRTEKEMLGVQEVLSELSAKASSATLHKGPESHDTASASSSSRWSSTSTPSRSSATTARNKVGDWLTPSPRRSSEKDGPNKVSPTQTRTVSPFRKIANRLHRAKESDASPPPPVPSTSSYSQASSRASQSPETKLAPLPSAAPSSRDLPFVAPRLQHRHTQSTATPQHTVQPPIHTSSALSERSRSPLPPARPTTASGMSAPAKPPWNAYARPVGSTELGQSLPASNAATKGRKSLPTAGTPGGQSAPGSRFSHIQSTYAQVRPQSRNFTTPTASFRPASPALSATSNTSGSPYRPRPTSPSRIPGRPSVVGTPSKSDYGSLGRSTARLKGPRQTDNGETLETLFFQSGAPDDEGGSSLLARAMSPTPSQSAMTTVSSAAGSTSGRRKSHIPRMSLSASQNLPSVASPAGVSAARSVSGARSDLMTPEPTLRSRAARVSAIYGGTPRTTGRPSLGLPSPHPSESMLYAGSPRHPRSSAASSSGTRPSSRLSVGGPGAAGGSHRASYYAPTSSTRATPIPDMPPMPDGGMHPYYANKVDPLDVHIAEIVNSQPLYVYCRREDPPLTKAAAEAQSATDRVALYWLAHWDKPISCKLVERGANKPKKVLCRVGGEWQDLSVWLLNQQAQY